MEILEHGKTYRIHTCPYCKCVFATCEKDFEGQRYWYDDIKNVYWQSIVCPECESKIYHKEYVNIGRAFKEMCDIRDEKHYKAHGRRRL